MLDSLPSTNEATSSEATRTAPGRVADVASAWPHYLDEVDYGLLLVDGEGRIVAANRIAHWDLSDEHPLHIEAGQLHAHRPQDAAALERALLNATKLGLRRLLILGEPGADVGVSVVPSQAVQPSRRGPTALVILGRREVCGDLAMQSFARERGLTPAEARVLAGLCEGIDPASLAERLGVAESTIRTQIGNIRSKTGTHSIAALVRRLSMLPPLISIVQGGSARC